MKTYAIRIGKRLILFPGWIIAIPVALILFALWLMAPLPRLHTIVCQQLYERMREAVIACEDSVTVEKPWSNSAITIAAKRLLDGDADCFHLTYVHYEIENGEMKIRFAYNRYRTEYQKNLERMNAMLDEIVSQVDMGMSRYEKVLWVHDYVCENYSYGGEHDVLSMLLTGEGVCSAYARLCRSLLDRLGVVNSVVYSATHTWNIVCLGGLWYHMDLTWDDAPAGYGYDNFLKSSAAIRKTGHDAFEFIDDLSRRCLFDYPSKGLFLCQKTREEVFGCLTKYPMGVYNKIEDTQEGYQTMTGRRVMWKKRSAVATRQRSDRRNNTGAF